MFTKAEGAETVVVFMLLEDEWRGGFGLLIGEDG